MQHCGKCKMNINGDKQYCPLCQGMLEGEGDHKAEIFPKARPKLPPDFLFLRIMTFGAIVLAVFSVALNAMLPIEVNFWLPAVGGIVCAWISLAIAVTKKYNIIKNIIWQLFILTLLSVIWDLFTGWNGWSLDYVIPCACMVAMLSMAILARVKKMPAHEFIIYLVVDGIYGIVPLIFLLTGILNVRIPSVICVACSLISISALLLFKGRTIKSEVEKKLHL